jgi:uncharacterized membrane protein YczE
MALHAGLGVSPWDVLHVGLGHHLHIATGTAMIGTGVVVLLLGLLLGVRPGFGTIFDILIVGNVVNLLFAHDPIRGATHWHFLVRVVLFSSGTVLTGLGIAIYIGAHVGAGPRDGLMIAFHQRFGWPVWKARLAVEAIGLAAGLMLRGPVGLGTVIWSLLLGWSAGIWFKVLHLTPDFVERGELVID